MTITQIVEIPPDRRITFNLPREIPTGTTAHFELIWFPVKKETKSVETTIKEIQELCKDIPFSTDSIREERRKDNEVVEKRYQKFISDYEVVS